MLNAIPSLKLILLKLNRTMPEFISCPIKDNKIPTQDIPMAFNKLSWVKKHDINKPKKIKIVYSAEVRWKIMLDNETPTNPIITAVAVPAAGMPAAAEPAAA